MDELVALVQGIYFLVFGIWPILSMSTFLKSPGRKRIYGWSRPLDSFWW